MITKSFDNKTLAKINPMPNEKREKCDVCIVTFSHIIKNYVLSNFNCKKVGEANHATGIEPFYVFGYNGKKFGFYQTWLGASASADLLEDATKFLDCKKFIFFGAAGPLIKELVSGKVMIPTYAYRDEGTSYHYVKPHRYIKIKNADIIEKFMKNNSIPYVLCKTWTTDGYYRETQKNIDKRKKEGCACVEMECSGIQAVCDFRGIDLYYFFLTDDLISAPSWLKIEEDSNLVANHKLAKFYIALRLADYIS